MTQRLKVEGVSVALPDDADLFVNEDGEIMVQELDGVFSINHYMVNTYALPRQSDPGPWG